MISRKNTLYECGPDDGCTGDSETLVIWIDIDYAFISLKMT